MLRRSKLLFSFTKNFKTFATSSISVTLFVSLLSLTTPTMAQENAQRIVKANNDLTTKIYAQVNKPNENVFFSPLSLHTILSLVYQGSKDDTETSFRSVLGIDDKLKTAQGYEDVMTKLNNIENVTLEIANKVYVKDGHSLKAAFKSIATKNFLADAENINFADSSNAAKSINGWVEEKTKNKIKDLISADSLDDMTRLVLVNAIYFKGDWDDKFNEKATTTEPFYTSETDSVDCKMMHKTRKFNYKEIPELDAKVLQIPYKNKDVSLVVVLPNKKSGITELESKLQNYNLQTLTDDMRYVEVELSLPKFKIETTMELNEPLKKLGLENAFSDKANFSDLLEGDQPLKISKVIQKAFIEVNEEGAEAAAATGMIMMTRCMIVPLDPIVRFLVDHPFRFYLKHNENVMFSGKLSTPKEI